MTVKDAVELAAVYLQLEDVLSTSSFTGTLNANSNPSVTADSLTTRNLNLLIRCTSLVLGRIASDLIPLIKVESVNSSSGKILYSALTSKVYKIDSVKKDGKKHSFKIYPTYILLGCDDGQFDVEYEFLPSDKTALTDNIDEVGNLVDARTIAYGVASEYAYISGLFEEAKMWEEKFKNALDTKTKLKNYAIKARRWF